MHSENLRRVADAIEKHEIKNLGFNMVTFVGAEVDRSGHGCGTTACNAGWAVVVLDKVAVCDLRWKTLYLPERAASLLQLTSSQRSDLFCRSPRGVYLQNVTSQMAVNVLRYAADHDIVDWDAANPELSA